MGEILHFEPCALNKVVDRKVILTLACLLILGCSSISFH